MEQMMLIDITVKTINNDVFNLSVSKNISIQDLKSRIKDSTEITEERQRLIYRGQVLSDHSSLTDYCIEDGHTIHLVSRPSNFRELQQRADENDSNVYPNQTAQHHPTLNNHTSGMRLMGNAATNPLLAITALADPLIHAAQAMDSTNNQNSSVNINSPSSISSTSLEHVRQSLLTMHTLISSMETIHISHTTPPSLPIIQREESYSDLGMPFSIRSPGVKKNSFFNKKSQIRGGGVGGGMENKGQGYHSTSTSTSTSSVSVSSLQPSSTSYSSSSPSSFSSNAFLPTGSNHTEPSNDNGNDNDNDNDNNEGVDKASEPPLTRRNVVNRIASKKFFVGQWLDVRDTVSQWLEATVLRVDDGDDDDGMDAPVSPRIFIHYNGWPSRWDEWLPVDSPRIAPFRTRTTHSPSLPHHCPVPNVPVPSAPRTGRDDLRTILPELSAMLCRLTPVLEEAAALSEESISQRPFQYDQRDQAARDANANGSSGSGSGVSNIARNALWTSPEHIRHMYAQTETQTETLARESPRLRLIASELCPLLDRFGRVLVDITPHLNTLANSPVHSNDYVNNNDDDDGESKYEGGTTATAMTGHGRDRPRSNDLSERSRRVRRNNSGSEGSAATTPSIMRPSSNVDNNSSRSSNTTATATATAMSTMSTEAALMALLRNRSPSPSADQVFRQPILVGPHASRSAQGDAGSGGLGGLANHLDIHIHAILTPLRPSPRSQESTSGSTSGSNTVPIPAATITTPTTPSSTSVPRRGDQYQSTGSVSSTSSSAMTSESLQSEPLPLPLTLLAPTTTRTRMNVHRIVDPSGSSPSPSSSSSAPFPSPTTTSSTTTTTRIEATTVRLRSRSVDSGRVSTSVGISSGTTTHSASMSETLTCTASDVNDLSAERNNQTQRHGQRKTSSPTTTWMNKDHVGDVNSSDDDDDEEYGRGSTAVGEAGSSRWSRVREAWNEEEVEKEEVDGEGGGDSMTRNVRSSTALNTMEECPSTDSDVTARSVIFSTTQNLHLSYCLFAIIKSKVFGSPCQSCIDECHQYVSIVKVVIELKNVKSSIDMSDSSILYINIYSRYRSTVDLHLKPIKGRGTQHAEDKSTNNLNHYHNKFTIDSQHLDLLVKAKLFRFQTFSCSKSYNRSHRLRLY
eukprot:gene6092-12299_t